MPNNNEQIQKTQQQIDQLTNKNKKLLSKQKNEVIQNLIKIISFFTKTKIKYFVEIFSILHLHKGLNCNFIA